MFYVYGVLSILAALLASSPAKAGDKDQLTFGVEFSAIPGARDHYYATNFDVEDVAETFAKLTGGSIRKDGHFHFVTTALGKWAIHFDGGAVEASTPVLTLEAAHTTDEIDKIFEAFRLNGLAPEHFQGGQFGGGGHIHIGRSIFDGDPVFLRNFWVHVTNNPWLQTIFEETGDEVALHPRETVFFDAQAVRNKFARLDYDYFYRKYYTTEQFAKFVPRGQLRSHAVNLSNLVSTNHVTIDGVPYSEIDTPTVELRFLRAPVNRRQTLARLDFFSKYIEYLKKIRRLIPLRTMTKDEVAFERLPTVALQKYKELIGLIDPQNMEKHLEEWNQKYMIAHAKNSGRSLELRLATETSQKRVYEILVRSQAELDVMLEANGVLESQRLKMTKLNDEVWVGQIEVPAKRADHDPNWAVDRLDIRVSSAVSGLESGEMSGAYTIALDYGLPAPISHCVSVLTRNGRSR